MFRFYCLATILLSYGCSSDDPVASSDLGVSDDGSTSDVGIDQRSDIVVSPAFFESLEVVGAPLEPTFDPGLTDYTALIGVPSHLAVSRLVPPRRSTSKGAKRSPTTSAF